MPQTSQFGTSNIVAEFQGFFAGGVLTTRAAQNCSVSRNSAGNISLFLNNVVPDDCNFLPQVHQFVATGAESGYAVAVAFPPVGSESGGLPTLNYIQFQFYSAGGTPSDPNPYGLFNIVVLNCNDGLVGVVNNTGVGQNPFRTPGNP